jgi:hypothetical protein
MQHSARRQDDEAWWVVGVGPSWIYRFACFVLEQDLQVAVQRLEARDRDRQLRYVPYLDQDMPGLPGADRRAIGEEFDLDRAPLSQRSGPLAGCNGE